MKALLEVVGHLWSQKTHTFLQRARRPQEASYICCGQTEKKGPGPSLKVFSGQDGSYILQPCPPQHHHRTAEVKVAPGLRRVGQEKKDRGQSRDRNAGEVWACTASRQHREKQEVKV